MLVRMNHIIAKISSYNIFNNLVPGSVFVYLSMELGIFRISSDSVASDLLIYYFIGLVINRIGSLVVEPMLRHLRFVHYGEYRDFITASAKDPKIQILLEESNQYRSFVALGFSLAATSIATNLFEVEKASPQIIQFSTIAFLIVLFGFAFRKQSKFIKRRVDLQK